MATVNHSEEEILENLTKTVGLIARKLKGWENVKSIFLKTDFSTSLPIFPSPAQVEEIKEEEAEYEEF